MHTPEHLGTSEITIWFSFMWQLQSGTPAGRRGSSSSATRSEHDLEQQAWQKDPQGAWHRRCGLHAQRLVEQLNKLLGDESCWSLGAKLEAAKRFDAKVIEIFFSEIEPRGGIAGQLRDKLLPLPSRDEGYARVLLMGVPGAGKTTLVRQLIGTNPKTERFPSTSVNRTTTFPTEVALRDGPYEGVVTFMSEYQARFEIEESLSAAFVEAVDGSIKQVARAFLEKSDMRFRLKYLLGEHTEERAEADPYEDDQDQSEISLGSDNTTSSLEERTRLRQTLDA